MSYLPEQFSEVRNSQIDAQFNFLDSYTSKAFESVEKVMALNFDVSRSSLERSAELMRQLVVAKDPRELFTLTAQSQSQFDSLIAYGRRLFGIAVDAAAVPPLAAAKAAEFAAAPTEPPTAEFKAPTEATPAPAASEPSAHAVMPAPELVVVNEAKDAKEAEEAQTASIAASIAEPNPVAKAVGHPDSLIKPSAASFPVPSSSKPIAVTPVKPVEAEPPPAPVSGTPDIVTRSSAAAPAKSPPRKK